MSLRHELLIIKNIQSFTISVLVWEVHLVAVSWERTRDRFGWAVSRAKQSSDGSASLCCLPLVPLGSWSRSKPQMTGPCSQQPLLGSLSHRVVMWHRCRKTAGVGLFFSSLHVSETGAARHCSHLQTVGSEWKRGSLPKDFQQSQEAGIEAAPWLAHELSVCLQATCFHFWVPLQCPCTGAGCQGSVSSGRAQTQASLCHGVLSSSHRLCLMQNHSSHCLTVLSPLVTAALEADHFLSDKWAHCHFRPVSKDFACHLQCHLQTGHSPSPLQRPYLHYKTNTTDPPTYNRAAFLHWFVPPRKGPGVEEAWSFPSGWRRHFAVCANAHSASHSWPSHTTMLYFSYCL